RVNLGFSAGHGVENDLPADAGAEGRDRIEVGNDLVARRERDGSGETGGQSNGRCQESTHHFSPWLGRFRCPDLRTLASIALVASQLEVIVLSGDLRLGLSPRARDAFHAPTRARV